MPTKRPPRLQGFDYLGRYRYFLTICVEDRRPVFRNYNDAHWIVAQFLQCAQAEDFAVTAYCLMPDHLHALVAGAHPAADFRHFVYAFKKHTGYAWKQRTNLRLWQEGYFDRVLRDEEGDLWVIAYIAENAVKAGLADRPEQYPFFGSTRYGIEEILTAMKELEPWRPHARDQKVSAGLKSRAT